jgi:NAD(P)H-hydrate epimerase
MERAGTEVARTITELAPAGPVRVVCGKGNNGGDGLVVTRLLHELGIPVEALLLWAPSELSADAQANHERLTQQGAPWSIADAAALGAALEDSGLVVDALLGTGFEGAPRPPLDAAIAAINAPGAPAVAIDVPSGVNASTGEVEGAAVDAAVTVTFHGPKVGLWVHPGKARAGRVKVVPIGIPPSRDGAPRPAGTGLIGGDVLSALRPRAAASSKFSSGSVLVAGGSTGLTGAMCMACEAAMRAGAGWVRAAVPESLNQVFEVKLTEVMSVPLPDRDGALVGAAGELVLAAAERADSVVLGPGLGREEESFALAVRLIESLERPLLLDADGLNALAAAGIERAASRGAPTILTPHAGELGRLLGRSSAEVERHRLGAVREAAERAHAVVALKGDDTLVADPDGDLVGVSEGGTPALATAGTGDVLSGIGGAFLARGLGPFEAACAAVRVHAQAGRSAGARLGAESVIAGDVIAALPEAFGRRSG